MLPLWHSKLNRIYESFAPTRLVVTPLAATEVGVELPAQPALPPEVVPLLEDLLRTYEQLARAGGEFPRLQSQAAEANCRIGDISQRLGRFEKAADAYRSAIGLYDQLPSAVSDDTVRIKLARASNELGRALRSLQQYDEANRMHEKAIRTLNEAPEEFAARPECRFELARSYCLLGQRDMLQSGGGPGPGAGRPGESGRGPPEKGKRSPSGRRPKGEPGRGPPPGRRESPQATRRAAELLERLVDEFPDVREYRHLLARCYGEMPPDPPGRGQGGSNAKKDRAIELLRKLVKDFPRVPDYQLDLCETLARPNPPPRSSDQRDTTNRLQRLEEAVSLGKQLVGQYPNVPDYALAHARTLDQLGLTLLNAKQLDEAEKVQRQAVKRQQRLHEQYPEVVAFSFWLGLMERTLGRILSERGQWKEARGRLESATSRVEGLWKKDSRLGGTRPFLGMAYRELARALAATGEPALASAAERKADEYWSERGPGPGGEPRP